MREERKKEGRRVRAVETPSRGRREGFTECVRVGETERGMKGKK